MREDNGENKKSQRLRILVSSDIHGRFMPVDVCASGGSVAEIAALAGDVRRSGAETVVLLDCGDLLTDSAQTLMMSPEMLGELTESAGYDALVPGNHDLGRELPPSPVPFVACNLEDGRMADYVIVERDGWRVAVTGGVTGGAPLGEALDRTLRKIGSLGGRKPDVTVALLHAGRDEAMEAVAGIEGLDLVVYGHDHTEAVFMAPGGVIAANPGRHGGKVVSFTTGHGRRRCELTEAPRGKVLPCHESLAAGMKAWIGTVLVRFDAPRGVTALLHEAVEELRGDGVSVFPRMEAVLNGDITPAAVYEALPYEDYPVRLRLSGREIRGMSVAGTDRLEDDRMYEAVGDSHTFPHGKRLGDTPLQSYLINGIRLYQTVSDGIREGYRKT